MIDFNKHILEGYYLLTDDSRVAATNLHYFLHDIEASLYAENATAAAQVNGKVSESTSKQRES